MSPPGTQAHVSTAYKGIQGSATHMCCFLHMYRECGVFQLRCHVLRSRWAQCRRPSSGRRARLPRGSCRPWLNRGMNPVYASLRWTSSSAAFGGLGWRQLWPIGYFQLPSWVDTVEIDTWYHMMYVYAMRLRHCIMMGKAPKSVGLVSKFFLPVISQSSLKKHSVSISCTGFLRFIPIVQEQYIHIWHIYEINTIK
jgi:hypothetical protein